MAKDLQVTDVRGARSLAAVQKLFSRLRSDGTGRDKAGNRQLFADQYVGLILLSFFNPTITSLRAMQQATGLATVQRWLGLRGRVSLGSLSEASRVFDPGLLRGVLTELAARVRPATPAAADGLDRRALAGLTAVDGSLLPVLPRMAHVLWGDAGKLSAKLHLHFEVDRGVPVDATLTPANASEIAEFRTNLRAGRLYVTDRGFASYSLLGDVVRAESSFVARLPGTAVLRDATEQPLSDAARQAGVERDAVGTLGSDDRSGLAVPVRFVVVRPEPGAGRSDAPLVLCTDRLDLPAELVAHAYRDRWQIELFFRWIKHVLGCRHLLSHDLAGITFQIYAALIACVLLGGATGCKPTKRTFEMACHFFSGWATEDELADHFASLQTGPDST
jgi:hypothetical protein